MLQHAAVSKGQLIVLTFTSEAATYDRYVADARRVVSSFAFD